MCAKMACEGNVFTSIVSLPAFGLMIMLIILAVFNHRVPLSQSDFHEIFISNGDNSTISSHLHSLTQNPHLAGTRGAQQALSYVMNQFNKLAFRTHTAEYKALLSYPLQRSLVLQFENGTRTKLWLDEADMGQAVAPYHAYAPSGKVSGKVVFANYGREEDFQRLREMDVNVSGCVVLCRNGELFRGEIVRRAAKYGGVALLLYKDSERFVGKRDGFSKGFGEMRNGVYSEGYGEKKGGIFEGYKERTDGFPGEGKDGFSEVEGDGFFKDDGIERGTVMEGLGDPLTPGWGAMEYAERLDIGVEEVRERFPSIPSLPISGYNAKVILESLWGPQLPEQWKGALHSEVGRVGSGPTSVDFEYKERRTMATIRNAFAVIKGALEPDRYVLLGNHRDAWTYGAVDPNSGTATLLEIARRFRLLLRKGWVPRRTIILCSWDAEEFGMIGSTEWVEQNLGNLGSKAVAYLNVDCAVQGPGFFAAATPQLDSLLVEVTKEINDPDYAERTVHQLWSAMANGSVKIDRLSGVASDFAPFLQHAGIPSLDMFFGEDFPVYHTAYDTYNWMRKYGDPLFHRHVAVSGIWGLLALRLADDLVLPFDYSSYSTQLQEHAKALQGLMSAGITLQPINTVIQELKEAAVTVADEAEELRHGSSTDVAFELKRRAFNDRLMLTERAFLDAGGLRGREWFKHLIYGPSKYSESKLGFFPGIVDAIYKAKERDNGEEGKALIQHEIWRVARAISRAAAALKGNLI
ncbi:hypothetical protein AMTRI_Chr03g149430 [Amborella trichopoda]